MKHLLCTTVFCWHWSFCLKSLQSMWKPFSGISTLLFHTIPEKQSSTLISTTETDSHSNLTKRDGNKSLKLKNIMLIFTLICKWTTLCILSPRTAGSAKGHWRVTTHLPSVNIVTSIGLNLTLHYRGTIKCISFYSLFLCFVVIYFTACAFSIWTWWIWCASMQTTIPPLHDM